MALVDRISLYLFSLLAVIIFFLGGLGPNSKFMDADWWQAYFDIMATVGLKFILPVWLILRFIDLVLGGPMRRRGHITARLLD